MTADSSQVDFPAEPTVPPEPRLAWQQVVRAARIMGGLVKDTYEAWLRDNARQLGAALAFYTALSLAPLAVLPGYQRQGVGSALVRRALEEARRQGHAAVLVLGHADYYPRFGFSAGKAAGVACPFGDAGPHWMALELVSGALEGVRGRAVYPPAFYGV